MTQQAPPQTPAPMTTLSRQNSVLSPRLEKIKTWMDNVFSPELLNDIKFYYNLDMYSFSEMLNDDQLAILDVDNSQIKIESVAPLNSMQTWLQFRLTIFSKSGSIVVSKMLPPYSITNNNQDMIK